LEKAVIPWAKFSQCKFGTDWRSPTPISISHMSHVSPRSHPSGGPGEAGAHASEAAAEVRQALGQGDLVPPRRELERLMEGGPGAPPTTRGGGGFARVAVIAPPRAMW